MNGKAGDEDLPFLELQHSILGIYRSMVKGGLEGEG